MPGTWAPRAGLALRPPSQPGRLVTAVTYTVADSVFPNGTSNPSFSETRGNRENGDHRVPCHGLTRSFLFDASNMSLKFQPACDERATVLDTGRGEMFLKFAKKLDENVLL